MNLKAFYENHINFSERTSLEYLISPGIRCKFDIIKEKLANFGIFTSGIDLGCSGDSILEQVQYISYKSYLDIANSPLNQYIKEANPICGDLQFLPYKNNSFEIIFALDVLEHIKNDSIAISEISRILKKKGLVMLTVPHRMRYYTNQDKIIGHYRRYEIEDITRAFELSGFKRHDFFGIYGLLMKISLFQAIKPKQTEDSILKLRKKFSSNPTFRITWSVLVKVLSKLMKIDAKLTPTNKVMNMGFIFIKT